MKKKLFVGILVLTMLVACLSLTAAAEEPSKVPGSGEAAGNMTVADFFATANNGKITLTGNVKLTDETFIAKGVGTMEIDLAGYELDTGNCLLVPTGDVVISGDGGGKLCSTGNAKNGKNEITAYPIIQVQQTNSSLTVKGGTIESTSRVAIWAFAASGQQEPVKNAVKIEGGTVTGKIGILTADCCTVEITGGTVIGTAGPGMQNGGPAEISGGEVKSTSSNGVLVMGSLVVKENAKITAEGEENGAAALQVNSRTVDGKPAVNHASATIYGGTITGKGAAVVTVNESELNIEGGTFSSTDEGDRGSAVNIMDNSTANISGGEITGSNSGIFAAGNSTVKVSGDAKITGTVGFGISTNGTGDADNENYGANVVIEISGGTVTGGNTACGIYLPAGTATVSDGEVKGGAGIVVRGGDLTVEGGTVSATGKDKIKVGDAKKGSDRYDVPAAGITVDTANYPAQAGGQKHVTVKDGATITAEAGGKTVAATNIGDDVVGGEGKVDAAKNPFDIQGGTFTAGTLPDKTNVDKFLRDGYEYDEVNGVQEKKDAEFEAVIGTQKYKTLAAAVEAATGGNTITLLKDVTLPGTGGDGEGRIEVTKKITLDLGGHELSKNSEITAENIAGLKVGENGDLTITGEGTFTGTGTLVATFAEGAKLTIEENVKIVQEAGKDTNNDAAVATNGGTITITGGNITAAESGVAIAGKSNLTVSGGKIDAKLFGIGTNGSKTDTSATITVSGGTITGGDEACGVYLPAGKMTVSDEASISGGAGIVVRGGELTVSGGSITATKTNGTVTVGDAKDDTAKYAVPAAGITLDKNDNYTKGNKKVTVSGGNINGNPTVAYTENGKTAKDSENLITISGGTFTGGNVAVDIDEFLAEGKIVSSDGKVEDGDGTLTIGFAPAGDTSTDKIDEPVVNGKVVTSIGHDDDTYNVQIIADEVKYHLSGAVPGVGGYWIGIYIKAPEGAEKVKDSFFGDELLDLDTIPEVDGKVYCSYYDLSQWAGKDEGDSFTVTFCSQSGRPVGRDYTINVDFSGAKMDDMDFSEVGFSYNADTEIVKDSGAETMYVKFNDDYKAGKYIVTVTGPDGYKADYYAADRTARTPSTIKTLAWSFLNDKQSDGKGTVPGTYTFHLYTYTGKNLTGTEKVVVNEAGVPTLDGYQFAAIGSTKTVDVVDEISAVVKDAKGNDGSTKAVVTAEADVNDHTINIKGSASNLSTDEAIEVTLDLSNGTDETAGTVTVKIEKDDEDWTKTKVSSVTGAIAGTEANQFKLLTKGEDFTVVADFAVVEVEVATGKTPTPEVPANLKDKIEDEDAKTMAEATKPGTSDTTLNELATEAVAEGPALNTDKGDAKTLLDDVVSSGDVQEDSIHFFVQPHLTLGITGYDDGADDGNKTFSVNINAVYDLVATTATTANDIKLEESSSGQNDQNAVIIGKSQPLTVNEPINLEVGLPSGFTQESEIYVKHTKDGGTAHYHKASVEGDVAKFFSDDGLSPFVFEAGVTPVASIGNTYYTTLQEAVDAVKDGGTITLVGAISEEETEVIVGREVSFKIDATAQISFNATIIKGGSGYTMGDPTVSGNVYEFTVTRSYTGGAVTTSKVEKTENGSVKLSSTTARAGQKVTVTATPDDGYVVDQVIVTDKNGDPVEVTDNGDGTYSYVVPAGLTPVTVKVTFKPADDHVCEDYDDVDENAWYHEGVHYAIEQKLMVGTGTGFEPAKAITRSEAWTILARMGVPGFKDAEEGEWYKNAQEYVMNPGEGKTVISDGTDPDRNVTREEFVVMLWRANGTPESEYDLSKYPDVDTIDSYDGFETAMKWAVEKGYITGRENPDGTITLSPLENIQRGEMAAILARIGATLAEEK